MVARISCYRKAKLQGAPVCGVADAISISGLRATLFQGHGGETGWEVHVGGTCGVRVRATDLLCKVDSDDAAVEHAAAFLQLYREEGHYLERSSALIERAGLPWVKGRVVDDAANRARLAARFFESQKDAQTDPWVERAGRPEEWATEYQPLEAMA